MSDPVRRILRVYEGEPLPKGTNVERILFVADEPWGTGTNMRRRYAVLLREEDGDCR